MKFVLVSTVMYDEKMYMPGGTVSNWVYEVASEFFFYLQKEVPLNKRVNKTAGEPPVGHLRESLFSDVHRLGTRELEIVGGARAYYTQYVVKGTPTIYAPRVRDELGRFLPLSEGGGMYLPSNPGYGPAKLTSQVRGQRANNFIGRAYDQTSLRHPALRGVSME